MLQNTDELNNLHQKILKWILSPYFPRQNPSEKIVSLISLVLKIIFNFCYQAHKIKKSKSPTVLSEQTEIGYH